MLATICSLHQLMSEKVTIACGNISALNNSLEEFNPSKISDAEHGLIYAVKNRIASIPMSHQIHYIKGHQDEVRPKKDLDQWSLLNSEMDNLAISLVNSWAEILDNQQIEGEP